MEEIEGEEVGGGFFAIGFFGAVSQEIEIRLLATIIDLQNAQSMHDISTYVHGRFNIVGLFYFITTYPTTKTSAIKGLGREIAKTIVNSGSSEKVRIAVLAVEPLNVAYVDQLDQDADKEQALRVLQEDARQGEPDTQWELYKRSKSRGEHDFKWLCKAAEQGDYRARWELGYIYYNGLYGARKDLMQSVMWYSLVEADGHNPIGVDNIREQFTPEQLSEAEHIYENWKPGRCGREITGTESINTP